MTDEYAMVGIGDKATSYQELSGCAPFPIATTTSYPTSSSRYVVLLLWCSELHIAILNGRDVAYDDGLK